MLHRLDSCIFVLLLAHCSLPHPVCWSLVNLRVRRRCLRTVRVCTSYLAWWVVGRFTKVSHFKPHSALIFLRDGGVLQFHYTKQNVKTWTQWLFVIISFYSLACTCCSVSNFTPISLLDKTSPQCLNSQFHKCKADGFSGKGTSIRNLFIWLLVCFFSLKWIFT